MKTEQPMPKRQARRMMDEERKREMQEERDQAIEQEAFYPGSTFLSDEDEEFEKLFPLKSKQGK